MTSLFRGALRGAGAGAAGTAVLDLVTNTDMAVRGRPASSVPQSVVATAAARFGTDVPGSGSTRRHRLDGLAAVSGTANGLAVGAVAGVVRAAGVRLPTAVGGPLLGAAAMLAADLPIARLGVSDPRRWSGRDWVTDALPHLAYGVVTHASLVAASREDEHGDHRAPSLPAPTAPDLLRAVSLGAATGCRSTAGVTAVALRSARRDDGPAGHLAGPAGRTLTLLLAAGETAADKHPSIPARTGGQGLAPRVLLGATASGAAARRDGVESGVPALVGAVTAAGVSFAGQYARSAAHRRFGTDLPAALAEDVLAGLLAAFGAGRRRTR